MKRAIKQSEIQKNKTMMAYVKVTELQFEEVNKMIFIRRRTYSEMKEGLFNKIEQNQAMRYVEVIL
ncbi:unnamed protein product [Paramecium sonneborni]|uniref:Uncharacterized protein n=1 Tax=Paramecium sonneborni TaxID=65129 RepID=A0A8S1LUW2_9CILI|nr:unnamed protein product [Paramecium sonneborni]